jgi:hypothetical protein
MCTHSLKFDGGAAAPHPRRQKMSKLVIVNHTVNFWVEGGQTKNGLTERGAVRFVASGSVVIAYPQAASQRSDIERRLGDARRTPAGTAVREEPAGFARRNKKVPLFS